jgi:hypothetical protein
VLSQDIATQAIGLIDCEQDIVQMELEHPERFAGSDNIPAPIAKWNGTIAELLELSVSVHGAGLIVKSTGEPMAYSDVISLVENIFGLTVSRPYECKSKLFMRKKDETPFLNRLIMVFHSEVERFYL